MEFGANLESNNGAPYFESGANETNPCEVHDQKHESQISKTETGR
jgi:hypothetical protein